MQMVMSFLLSTVPSVLLSLVRPLLAAPVYENLIRTLVVRLLEAAAARTSNTVDDELVAQVKRAFENPTP